MNPGRTRLALSAFAIVTFITVLAGDGIRNLVGWWGYLVLAVGILVVSVIGLIRMRPADLRWRQLPKSLLAFLGLATVSVTWSVYPGATALGIVATIATTLAAAFLALCFSWTEAIRALGSALRWVLGVSLVFEGIVTVFVGHPVLPVWAGQGAEALPDALYWSRDLLGVGGPIQGIVGNRNTLAFIAALAVIVFAVQLAGSLTRRFWGWFWLAVATVTLILTRSATTLFVLAVLVIVLVLALWARRRPNGGRVPIYTTALVLLVVGATAFFTFLSPLMQLLGKSEDGTGRLQIWSAVAELAGERPGFGWGWVSYWAPWVEPFDGLVVRDGVTYLQAHNAWLDVWLQLGVVGLLVFAVLVISTLTRTWFLAVDRPHATDGRELPFTASSLLPLLIVTALVVQSLAESRILVESGWLLLVLFSIKTKRQQRVEEPLP